MSLREKISVIVDSLIVHAPSLDKADQITDAILKAIEAEGQRRVDLQSVIAYEAGLETAPKGWKLVPEEPTEDMATAAIKAMAVIKAMQSTQLAPSYIYQAAIRADERERLAKAAEDDQLEADLGMDSTMRQVRMSIAKWIRSQGEDK